MRAAEDFSQPRRRAYQTARSPQNRPREHRNSAWLDISGGDAAETEENAMKTREERIEARARELREADGKSDSTDRKYWTQAAQLIDEEDERIAKAEVEEPSRMTQPGADRRGPWPTNDPIGVTVKAARRQD
jgi:hypothetical protein